MGRKSNLCRWRIKANSLEEAEKIMKAVFLGSRLTDVEIYCIEEHWLN